MSPLERIAQGIRTNDMEEVALGYHAITGDSIPVGKMPLGVLLNKIAALANEKIIIEEPETKPAGKTSKKKSSKPQDVSGMSLCELCGKFSDSSKMTSIQDRQDGKSIGIKCCQNCSTNDKTN
jgi:hypothetical protein